MKFVMKKHLTLKNKHKTFCFLLISFVCFQSCRKATSINDIDLNPGEAVYSFTFYHLDNELKENWIWPHISSLHGDRYKSITQSGIIGNRCKIFVFVKIEDSDISAENLRELNKKTLASLKKKTNYELDIRIGKMK